MNSPAEDDRAHFRGTLVRVLGAQVIALLALWALQALYHAS